MESLGHDTTGLGKSGFDFERSGMQSTKRVNKNLNPNVNASMFSMLEVESRQMSGVRNIQIPQLQESPIKDQS